MTTQEFLDKLFLKAKEAGFEASEAYITDGESFSAGVFQGEVNEYSVSTSLHLQFRALVNGKMGCASTEVFDEDAVSLLIEGAKTNALLIENEDREFIFPGSKEYPKGEAYNPALEEISAARKLEMVKLLEKTALSLDARVTQPQGCEVFSESGGKRIVNSMGLDVSSRSNCIGCYVAVVGKDGERVNDGMEALITRDMNAFRMDDVAKAAVDDALECLNGESVPSGKYNIVLDRGVASSILGAFCGNFSADAAQKGLSLLADKEGKTIAAPCVCIADDPMLEDGRSFSTFDDEGVACFRKNVVENGVLKTLLHNLKTAEKAHCASTGNGARSGLGMGVAPSNFFIEKGDLTRDGLFEKMGEGLCITHVMGLHSGANPITGDFSLGAKGFAVHGGKKGEGINQITIAGNFYDLLKNVQLIANDLRFNLHSVASPSLFVGEMSVAGRE